MKRLVVAALGALLLSGAAAAKSWTVDPAQSALGFTVAVNGEPVAGHFKQWTAAIEFDPANLSAAKATVKIDLMSADTGNGTRDDALPGEQFFDAEGKSGLSYTAGGPAEAVFETSVFRQTGEGAYEADGTLTMRGVAQPVTLPFTLAIDGATAKMDGKVSIDRTKWGVGQGEYADDKPVALQVEVTVQVTATAQ